MVTNEHKVKSKHSNREQRLFSQKNLTIKIDGKLYWNVYDLPVFLLLRYFVTRAAVYTINLSWPCDTFKSNGTSPTPP